jgi:hypothetical protein
VNETNTIKSNKMNETNTLRQNAETKLIYVE